ncbi:MAG: metallophosphoesterase, partial [Chloroflexota bacterium]
LDGLRIGFLTDTHVRSAADARRAAEALSILAGCDLLLLGGDFVSEAARYARPLLAALEPAVRDCPLGVFAVVGNHDFTVGVERVARDLAACGVAVLRDANTALDWNGQRFWVAGFEESLLAGADVERAMSGIPPGAFTVAVWHEPDWADAAAAAGASLQLSGHTHGGQVRLPFVGAVAVPEGGKRWVAGWHCVEGMPLYVSRGLGTYRPPVRFRCSPEVTVLTLRAGDGPACAVFRPVPSSRLVQGA